MTAPVSVNNRQLHVPQELVEVLQRNKRVTIPANRQELVELAAGGPDSKGTEVSYEVPGRGIIKEADAVRCRNGIAVNYVEPYMRRRDPECMVVADDDPSDKTHFSERFDLPFADLRSEIFDWLAEQELILVPFHAGGKELGSDALLVAPRNAGFFAAGLADLQGLAESTPANDPFSPRAVIYVAPPFRHTHCRGKQVVIHNRIRGLHEIFSLNLYPGPSAKKGVYGFLLSIGESEGWITAHGSTVQVVTPYDNIVTIMHEGASGGGKSEMLEYAHRQPDGQLLLGENIITKQQRFLTLPRGCGLRPVTDDMALCHPDIQSDNGKLVVTDAEAAWFLRINHIERYGTDPYLEGLCIHPKEPLIFLNLHGVADATCLIWEHIEDEPGQPCPNPRVIMPRRMVPNVVNHAVEVDVRSFGIRTPPCTRDAITYGVIGMLHLLPPALAWLWRLVAPRGFANPSITESEALTSEGVGSYWPFATGRRVDQANLILRQIVGTPHSRYTLSPNQHIGAWRVGFMPQWISREYLARRGSARFRPDQLEPAREPLLGMTVSSMMVEGTQIPSWLLQPEHQAEIGEEVYDKGAAILKAFFKRELKPYIEQADLDGLGKQIIECCLSDGTLADYTSLIPHEE